MRRLAPLLAAASTVPLLTALTHGLLAGWSRPARVEPLAIGPYDHVGPLSFAGFADLGALAALALTFLLFCALFAWLLGGFQTLGTRELLPLGLLLGGVASNAVEVLLRGGAMDWLWISTAPGYAMATNWADLAMVGGLALLLLAVLRGPRRRPAP